MSDDEQRSVFRKFFEAHYLSVVGGAMALSIAALAGTVIAGDRFRQGLGCSYDFVWTAPAWLWVVALTAATSAWAVVVYLRRKKSWRNSSTAKALGLSTVMTFGAWGWFVIAWAWPILNATHCTIGRPLRINDRLKLPSIRVAGPTRARLKRTAAPCERLTRRERRFVGMHWLECARGEYASIPAFERLAAQLVALEAPSALVDRALRSATEEAVHAHLTAVLAERMLGRSFKFELRDLGPTPAVTIQQLAMESLIDGCLNEGCAAAEAQARADVQLDPEVAALLAMIAVDEFAHAELGWDIVRWALEREPATVRQSLESLELPVARSGFAFPAGCDKDRLRGFGWMEPELCKTAHFAVMTEVRAWRDVIATSNPRPHQLSVACEALSPVAL